MTASANNGANVNQMFEQAAKLFENALQAGIRIQQESTKSLTEMMSKAGSPQEWQKKAQTAMEQAFTTAQTNADEAIGVMNENAKSSLELLQKAFDSRQPESASDVQARAREAWETAIGSLRRNAEVMVQSSNRVVESWKEIAKIMRAEEVATEA
jgi:sialic acid synthase SpsE